LSLKYRNLGITDNHWFSYLSELHPDEINFGNPAVNKRLAPSRQANLFCLNYTAPRTSSLAAVFSLSGDSNRRLALSVGGL
jgi:hypothetical protein